MQQRKFSINPVLLFSALVLSLALFGCADDSDDTDGSGQVSPSDTDLEDNVGGTSIGRTVDTAIGAVFVFGSADRTVYTFANDADGQSNCVAGCSESWPPVAAESRMTVGQFSTIEREDGSLQWAFKRRPIYYYQGDAGAGEVTGEGVGGVWSVTRPDPVTTRDTLLGSVLVGRGSTNSGTGDPAVRINVDGMTLYTFQNDSPGTSVCSDQCATNWPPHFADDAALAADGYTLVSRSDGTVQWAREGQPLYRYQGDSSPGDTNG
ncbi:MAG: COG4315 family predicted lipoprotein, partial [bacterium]